MRYRNKTRQKPGEDAIRLLEQRDSHSEVRDSLFASREDEISEQGELALQVPLDVLWSGGAELRRRARFGAEVAGAFAQDDVRRVQLPLQTVEEGRAASPRFRSDGVSIKSVVLGGSRPMPRHSVESALQDSPVNVAIGRHGAANGGGTYEEDLVRIEQQERLLFRRELSLTLDQRFRLLRDRLQDCTDRRKLSLNTGQLADCS